MRKLHCKDAVLIMGMLQIPTIALAAPDCAETGTVEWEVVGRFATLKGEEARVRGDALLGKIAQAKGNLVNGSPADVPPATAAYPAIVDALVANTTQDGPPLFTQTYYDRGLERYTELQDLLKPSHYTIKAAMVNAGSGTCLWTIGHEQKEGPCEGTTLQIGRNWNETPQVTPLAVNVLGHSSEANACILIEEKLITAFGDSYASGEGNPDQPTDWSKVAEFATAPRKPLKHSRANTLWWVDRKGPLAQVPASADAQWWDNTCHRSLLSQQSLAALAYAAQSKHRVTTFLSFSCSGATILDGLVGPRAEAPGMGRLDANRRHLSTALSKSQINQAVETLCAHRPEVTFRSIPKNAQAWLEVELPMEHAGQRQGTVAIATCRHWLRKPDAVLLTVGGNDVGFGGVGYWAIVPPNSRWPLRTDFVISANVTEDRDARKKGFGVVCPAHYRKEIRCDRSTYSAEDLAAQLPALQTLADEAFQVSGLGQAPVKIKTGYPVVTRDEDGLLCGRLWSRRHDRSYQFQIEPWASAYARVLGKGRFFGVSPAAPRDWSFGMYNLALSDRDCYPDRRSDLSQQEAEICEIEKRVFRPLNAIVTAPRAGWINIDQGRLPTTRGICAADRSYSREPDGAKLWDSYRKDWGWPQWSGESWNSNYPVPMDWEPYRARQRWVRTANDSALSQAVFYGGLGRTSKLEGLEDLRLGESNSGSIHATAEMHAALAELVVEKLKEADKR